jgi:sodium transport system permease protein
VSGVLYALLGPFIMLVIFSVLGAVLNEQSERPLELPVAGGEHAPALVTFLEQRNVTILPAPADAEAAVKAGEADMVLVIPPGYGEKFLAGQPAALQLVSDSSRQAGASNVRRTRDLLENYAGQIGALRLQARGISPAVVTPLALEEVDVATPQSQAAQLLNLLPYFIVFGIFLGGMAMLVDTTAGERERGSLEPLLINPLNRAEFVLGKMAAAALFTLGNIAITLIAFALIMNFVPIGEGLGVQLSLEPLPLLGIFLLVLPILLLAVSLQMIIASASKTSKEAQSYLSFLPLVPALPGMVLAFLPVRPELWVMLIPTFGQQVLINQLLRGEAVSPLNVAVATLVTLLLGGLFTWFAVKFYQQERLLFGR